MSSIQLTLKLFRHNLKATAAYLVTLVFAVAMYYDFTILKYSPEMLGADKTGTTVIVCATLMSVVMVIVFVAFVWSSSRFFLSQRKKEIGLYALCGVPMKRVGRVFLWDSLLTGLCALGGGLSIGILLTKLFLMGAGTMIKLERPMSFILPLPAVLETCAVVGAIFLLTALRNALTVRKSKLIDLLHGMRVAETPPKRRTLMAVLAVITLALGYGLSAILNGALIVMALFISVPILLLVVIGSYWLFQALLPMILEKLTHNKQFFYRGMRMVGISNLWYRLRTNYRNLALTSILSATAIVTLCTALTMSDYVGAREGKHMQRLIKTYSLTSWMNPNEAPKVQDKLDAIDLDAERATWILMSRAYPEKGADGMVQMVIELSEARKATQKLMNMVNLPVPELTLAEGEVIQMTSPDHIVLLSNGEQEQLVDIGGREMRIRFMEDLWLFGGDSSLRDAYIVPDGWMQDYPHEQEQRLFLGLTLSEAQTNVLYESLKGMDGISLESTLQLTTSMRMLYGTLAYLGLIMFVVFSLLTGCALMFKQLSEATADRLKYQSMIHVGATNGEIRRAVNWQVGLSLLLPLLLGFVHAAFAVRVMGAVFDLPTMGYLLIALGVYGVVVLVLYLLTVQRFMRIVT